MADHLILMKGPNQGNVASYTAPASIPAPIIPNNISQAIGTTLDMSQYIIDVDSQRTSTAVYMNGIELPDPVTNAATPTTFVSYDPDTEYLHFDNVGQAQGLTLEVCASDLMSLPLLTADQFEYIGSFNTPTSANFATYEENVALAYSGNNTLFITGYDEGATAQTPVTEISIPELKTSNYETATILQPWVAACGGKQSQVTGGSGNDICGMTVHNRRLIIHVATFYDPGTQTESTFSRSTTLTNSAVSGPCKIGDLQQRYIAGGGMTLPDAWRTEFGGYASVCGGGGGLSLVNSLSNGPTFIFYNPDEVVGTNNVTATPATYYPSPNDIGSFDGPITLDFTGMSTHRNTFVVDGYSTMIGFGRHGDSAYYSPGQTLPDGTVADQNGQWAVQALDHFWLYDAADVKDAFDGTVANNAPRAYEKVGMMVSYSGAQSENGNNRGGTFDSANNIFYIMESHGNGSYPRIHAVRINV